MLGSTLFLTLGLLGLSRAHFVIPYDDQDMSGLTVNSIPAEKRVEYMRKTNEALYRQSGPCPFAAFGAIIVNHTSDEVVCEGANFRTGDPTIHGEISAINACTAKVTKQGMTPTEIFAAWGDLSIYTNAESCPMCASAIRWAGFKEYVYGTTIQHNYNVGWGVMTLSNYDVFQQSRQLPGYQTVMTGQILTNETDPLFSRQYNASAPCPNECFRVPSAARGGSTCSNVTVSRRDYEGL
ncbi:cytidine and deoxycytidylate deaminase zinc-binding region [Colletotrichum graminicola]|uniref:Cytidine and deoxycytidylate deaminase zinc-binding region n=1 Tax=Colletotrichum graminicola (strain M1.001 / M2 / FGSC 10212) TaxID=645133 RepID=E3QMN4_COLGM|nr:cytidine and deoxycytidylate deaminase zinc-binding region [Colletotrichum graminicola M1.001]EFQ32122.1 cytidine and deoxycytidylate deaminase zinc-binding region [Colletotrichum graminicola M1.001]WDK16982.1 cytidine and deoxycytidylate deaminase zinc-binding region [Colletotrichum graminicola]